MAWRSCYCKADMSITDVQSRLCHLPLPRVSNASANLRAQIAPLHCTAVSARREGEKDSIGAPFYACGMMRDMAD